MASPSTLGKPINDAVSDENKNCNSRPKSHFQKTVCLEDWWLLKAENDSQGGGLSVAGFTSREQRAMRVFSSAPILKRYDVFTLETTDGICVIIKGFINKARTAENGFPSDVFNHFVFGFPLHWKEYAEKCMCTGSHSTDNSGRQSHVDSHERDVGCQDKKDAKGMRKRNKTKSSTVLLPPKTGSVIRDTADSTIVSCIVPGGLENKFYSGESTTEDQKTMDMPVNCPNKKSLTISRLGGNTIISALIDKDVYDFQNHSGGILSACRLYNESRGTKASDDLKKVKLDQKNSVKLKFNRDMNSSDGIINHTKSRATTGAMSKLERKYKNEPTSAHILGGKKTSSKSVLSVGSEKVELASVISEPGEATRLNETTDKMNLIELDAGFVTEKFELISETLNQDKDRREVKTKGGIEKAKLKVMRSQYRPGPAGNKEHAVANERNLSEHDGSSAMKARRKLAYETPGREKERVPSGSPQSLSLNRSRSGRLLMPTLEFWRNQRALYDADGTVTGIEEEIHLEHPTTRGSKSTPQRKKRQLQ